MHFCTAFSDGREKFLTQTDVDEILVELITLEEINCEVRITSVEGEAAECLVADFRVLVHDFAGHFVTLDETFEIHDYLSAEESEFEVVDFVAAKF